MKRPLVLSAAAIGVAAAALLCVFWLAFPPGEPSRTARPNVILLSIDTLRADHLGLFGAQNPTSPAIDRFARSCFVFPAAYAPRGETAPSLASAFTGLYPSGHGVFNNHCLFPGGIRTIIAAARDAGYITAAFCANKAVAPSKIARDFTSLRFTVRADRPQWQDDDAALRHACAFLETARRPFFLWVHFMDPHSPYDPSPEDRGKFATGVPGIDGSRQSLEAVTRKGRPLSRRKLAYVRALYDEEIRGTDRRVGRLLEALSQRRLWKNTLVVLFADHGEELGDHHNYFFHQVSVYRPVLHVPLLWYLPPGLKAARKEGRAGSTAFPHAVASLVDIAPTVASLLGLPSPREVDGIDLSALFRGGRAARSAVMTEYADKISGIITLKYHALSNPTLFCPYGGPFLSPEERRRDPSSASLPVFRVKQRELYDIQTDPLEQEDIAAVEREVWNRLHARIQAFRKAHPFRRPLRIGSQAALKALADLGYVQGVRAGKKKGATTGPKKAK